MIHLSACNLLMSSEAELPVSECIKILTFWQRKNEEKYQQALVEVKNDLKEKEGDEIQEKLKQEIREWFQKEQWVQFSILGQNM